MAPHDTTTFSECREQEGFRATIQQLEVKLAELKKSLLPLETDTYMGQLPDVSLETVRKILKARRQRGNFFGEDLFGEPAWDILLELFAAELAQHKVSVSSACIGSAAPMTTALRWLKKLEDNGLVSRQADAHDARRQWVQLSPHAFAAMRQYLATFATEFLPI